MLCLMIWERVGQLGSELDQCSAGEGKTVGFLIVENGMCEFGFVARGGTCHTQMHANNDSVGNHV